MSAVDGNPLAGSTRGPATGNPHLIVLVSSADLRYIRRGIFCLGLTEDFCLGLHPSHVV